MSPSSLMVGVGQRDITAPLHVPYLGFDPRQSTFEGIHDHLLANAVVFANQETAVAVLSVDALGISTDLFGLGRDFVAEVRQRAAEGTGIRAEHILIAATHAHSTPETYGITRIWERQDCAEWIEDFAERLAQTVRSAWEDRAPAVLSVGATTVPGISGNRRMRDGQGRLFSANRKPDGAVVVDEGARDESVTVLLADRGEDAPAVAIANFASHPVTVQVQPLVSRDFPGVATDIVEQAMDNGGRCVFLQGASGDINPIRDATRDWDDVQTYGLALGGGILQALAQARLSEPIDGSVLGARRETVIVEPRTAPTEADARAELDEAEEQLAQADADHPEHAARYGRARQARELYRLAQFGLEPIQTEVQALRIGDVGIAALPGELFCEFGLQIKEQSPAAATMVAELANGCLGYLAPQHDWDAGGYEVSQGAWCRVGPGGPEKMVDAVSGLLKELFE